MASSIWRPGLTRLDAAWRGSDCSAVLGETDATGTLIPEAANIAEHPRRMEHGVVASFARRLASVVRSILMNVFMLKEMVRCHHRLAALHPQSALACILNMYAHHDPARRHGSDLTFCATQMNVVCRKRTSTRAAA